MKPKLVTYKCIKHISEECLKEWQEWTVEDPPYRKECSKCFEQFCQDENELTSDCD